MDKKNVVTVYLDLLDRQRNEVFSQLEQVDQDLLWKRLSPGKWSIGEQLDHTRAITRFMRRFITLIWPFLFLTGWLRRNRAYEADIDDVYERPGFPLNVGWLWPPKYTPDKPVPLSILKQALEDEHGKVKALYKSKPVEVLGNALLYDPAIGWLNLLQVLRVDIHHDAHHYRVVQEILKSLEAGQGRDGSHE